MRQKEFELRPSFRMGLKLDESSLRGSLGMLNTGRVCHVLFNDSLGVQAPAILVQNGLKLQ
jgi:hypothetical protein